MAGGQVLQGECVRFFVPRATLAVLAWETLQLYGLLSLTLKVFVCRVRPPEKRCADLGSVVHSRSPLH